MTAAASLASQEQVNIAWYLPEVARKQPHQRAVVVPASRDRSGRRSYLHLTFEQLDQETNRLARGLSSQGIERGTKVIVMVRPSLEFFSITFALFKLGAVPVLIDPGMGRKGFLAAVAEARPQALIGIPLAHVLSTVFPSAFSSVERRITVGRRLWWGGQTLEAIRDSDPSPFELAPTAHGETAAILFTSGSTGPAKGVVYTHGIFDTQARIIREEWGLGEGDIDLPAFPLFALFSCALGVTCIIPDMDASHPARADGAKIVEAIQDQGVTYSFGSPAFWKAVGKYCEERGLRLPSLKKIIMAGAPVPPTLIEQFRGILPADGDVHIPYGATEALPVSRIRGAEVLAETAALTARGAGSCVGRPIRRNEVQVIRITDDPIQRLEDAEILPAGQVGELIVKGPVVTPAYHARESDTAQAKIREGAAIWHRMGDVGYLDESGRVWFCGRKSHRVETNGGPMYSVRCEAIFNNHPRVYRSALVGLGPRGAQEPVIVVECEQGRGPTGSGDEERLRRELLDLAAGSELTRAITRVLFHPSFPVDVRHNAKIRREELAAWAQKQLA